MTSGFAIAAAQTVPTPGDVAANAEQHARLVRAAAQAGARAVVFPELSLTGYELDLAARLAFVEDDPRLDPLVDLATSCDAILVVGAPVRIDARLHIGAFILQPDGTVALYTKHHLGAFSESAAVDGIVPPAESTVFDPGDRNPAVAIAGHRAAVAVCSDAGRSSHQQAAADRGAELYLASMFVIPSEIESEQRNLADCAARASMAVVFANHGGPSGGLACAGRSAIWSERGELVGRIEGPGAGVVVATRDDTGWRSRTVML